MYKRLTNPREIDVDKTLNEGYSLHSVTPVLKRKLSTTGVYETDLVYHFIKKVCDWLESKKI